MKIAIAATALLATSLSAMAEGKLKIGDAAPPIKSGEWIQGEAVKELARDTVYVVEFWATWCGPCIATIPHLDELHEELKDSGVVFIGQNCWERDLAKVKPFVEKMGEKMSYRVATDDTSTEEKGFMAVNWMAAAGQKGIPAAFVVGKDGKIAWIGHPGGLKADLLKQVVAGTFDSTKAAAEQETREAAQSAMQKSAQKLGKALKAKDWESVATILDEMEKENPAMAPQFAGLRLNIAYEKGDSAAAAAAAGKMISGPAGESAAGLNEIAWGLVTKLKEPSAEVLEVAAKAAELGMGKDEKNAAVIDTLARVQFLQGKKEEAIKTQEKAVAKADEDLKEELEATLDAYKKGELPEAQ